MTEERQKIIFCGVLTVSDRCAAGTKEDTSGPNLQKLLQEFSGFKAIVKVRKIVPDNLLSIKSTLIDWADKEGCNLILTTGGTGIAPRDVTPEATSQVIERELKSVVTGIIAASLAATRFSMLSRMICGTRGKCFILNLPGSKPVAEECFKFVLPILEHAVDLLKNNIDDVESFHKLAGTSSCTSNEEKKRKADSRNSFDADSCGSNISQTPSSSAPALALVNQTLISNLTTGASIAAHTISHGMHSLVHGMDHGAVHGLSHEAVHGFDNSVGHGHGMEAGDAGRILTVSEMELDLDSSELEKDSAVSGIETSDDIPASVLPKKQKVSIEKLVEEKRRIDPDCIQLPTKVARRDRTSKYPLIPVDQAKAIVLENTPVLPVISVSYKDAMGYVLAEDVRSSESLPAFPASIKDGYAIIASDTPGVFSIIGSSIYGVLGPSEPLKKGQAVRITTGSPVPTGADAVVQVEDTRLIEEAEQGELEVKISITTKAVVGQDIRRIGSDIKKGDLVLPAGTFLGASEIGVLASIGFTEVPVYKKPVVAVVSTGNELTEPESSKLHRGQVRDSNRITLLSALKQAGFPVIDIGIAPDDLGKLQLTIETALEKADVIISSGGVSMGERDFLKTAIELVGGTIHFGRVLMKPGKPTTFATVNSFNGKKLFFALPGNPVSSIVTFNIFTLSALKKMMGCCKTVPTMIKARVSSEIKLDARPEYQRCAVSWKPGDATPWAASTGNQISSRLASMVQSNALLVLPSKEADRTEIVRGELVDALLTERL